MALSITCPPMPILGFTRITSSDTQKLDHRSEVTLTALGWHQLSTEYCINMLWWNWTLGIKGITFQWFALCLAQSEMVVIVGVNHPRLPLQEFLKAVSKAWLSLAHTSMTKFQKREIVMFAVDWTMFSSICNSSVHELAHACIQQDHNYNQALLSGK